MYAAHTKHFVTKSIWDVYPSFAKVNRVVPSGNGLIGSTNYDYGMKVGWQDTTTPSKHRAGKHWYGTEQ